MSLVLRRKDELEKQYYQSNYLQKRLRKRLDTQLAFVDFDKVSDSVNWNSLFARLRKIRVKYEERNVT